MFSGGDYEEVARWLRNFVRSHARRENLRAEAVVEASGPREGRSYGLRVRVAERLAPPSGERPLELDYAEVAAKRGSMAWCQELAGRVRALVRSLGEAGRPSRRSA
jgi:hypothetical protein